MSEREPRGKQVAKKPRTQRHHSESISHSAGPERQILEMIIRGAPLADTLNKLCIMIETEIGEVVSVVSLPGAGEGCLCPDCQSAMQTGLDVFSSTDILSRDEMLLGTLEIYGCDSRRPTPDEKRMIERVTRLAAIALQRHEDIQAVDRFSENPGSVADGSDPNKTPFVN